MKALLALIVLGLIGFGLVEAGIVRLPEIGSVTKLMQSAPAASLPGVELKSLSSKDGFLQGSFVISNANAFAIADAAIHCDVDGPGGTVVQSFDFVIHEPVPANGKKAIADHNFGFWPEQGGQMRCRSISVERR